jgi:hypothetical protein
MNRLTTLGKALVVFFAGLAIAAVVTLVSARSSSREPAAGAARGLGALSARAQAADDLSADNTASETAPMQVAIVVFAPSHGSSPRIIHVPQSGDRDNQASANNGDEAVATIEPDDDIPPPPRHRVIPLPRHSDAPAPQTRAAAPAPKRQADIAPLAPMAPHRDVTILQKLKPAAKLQSKIEAAPRPRDAAAAQPQAEIRTESKPRADVAPPQLGVNPQATSQAQPVPAGEADAELTPVYPTPRYDHKVESGNGTVYGPSVSAHAPVPPPPVGYAPPSGLPYRSN